MTLNWAIHRVNGISSPANAAYSVQELRHQLVYSKCKALFTVMPLLPTALEAARLAGIPTHRIFLCDMPGHTTSTQYKSLEQLINEGGQLADLEPLRWTKGQGARQTAFLCYSSGTSGLPVSHDPHGPNNRFLSLVND